MLIQLVVQYNAVIAIMLFINLMKEKIEYLRSRVVTIAVATFFVKY